MADGGRTRDELLEELAALKKKLDSCEVEKRFLESEATARALLNAPHDSALLVEPDGTIVTANEQAARRFGFPVEDLEGKSVFDFFPDDVTERRKPFGEEVMRTGKPARQVDQRDGRWFDYTIYPIKDGETGKVVRFAIFARDITDQKVMESALRDSEEKYRSLVEESQQGIVVFSDGRFGYANRAAAGILRYSVDELMAMTAEQVMDTIYTDDRESMFSWIASVFSGKKDPSAAEYRCVCKDGAVRWFRVFGSVIEFEGRRAVQGIVLDIDDLKKLEQRIAQAAKLEAVGRLAGGVAHDFNNLLTVILGYSRSLVRKMDRDDPLHESAREIDSAAVRAATLTRQLLTFSREKAVKPTSFDVNGLVRNMENMLTSLLGSNVEFDLRLAEGLGMVKTNPGQLEQVLMNLVLNGRDAMEGGGTMTIETSRAELTAEALTENPDALPGCYIRLAVTDTGIGLDEKQLRHIFEPFFSTKGLTEGTGLGLSVVYGIVRQHGGIVTVESEPGRGSCFAIHLPLNNDRFDPEKAEERRTPQPVRAVSRVLVVEDELVVRRFVARTLREFGYEVAEASSVEEAEAEHGSELEGFALLLADFMLPGRSGITMVKSITARRPDLAVVLTSGHAVRESELQFALVSRHQYLEKPFTDEELLAAVQFALERSGDLSSGT